MALEQSKSSERVGTFGRAGRIARVDRMAGPGKLATLKRNTLTADAVDGPREGALLTTEDVARITHLSVETLAQWRSQRKGNYRSHYSGANSVMGTNCKSLKNMARPEGIEPPTFCVEVA